MSTSTSQGIEESVELPEELEWLEDRDRYHSESILSPDSNFPDRILVDEDVFEKLPLSRQGQMTLSYENPDSQEFLQFIHPFLDDEDHSYKERLLQAVVRIHNNEKMRELGITPLVRYDDDSIEHIPFGMDNFVAIRGELVNEDDFFHDPPPKLIGEYRDEFEDVGWKMYDAIRQGEIAYIEGKGSWIEDLLSNRAIYNQKVVVTDMGELGPEMFRYFQELDSSVRDFVFDEFDEAPFYNELEFLGEPNLIERFLEHYNTPMDHNKNAMSLQEDQTRSHFY